MRWPPRTREERFWEKVDKSGGCWLWTAWRDRLGYGRFDGKLSHRISYEIAHGPIPAGLTLDHLCRNPSCVNPGHLEPVTHAENVRRGIAGEVNRERLRAVTHCKRGHEFTPDNTYIYPNGYRECRTCQRARKRRLYHTDIDHYRAYGREKARERARRRKEATAMKTLRQGDVLLVAIDPADVPADVKPVPRENGRAILAHGEITGHAHAILDEQAELVTADQAAELYLLVHGEAPVDLVHDEHSTIPLEPGAYKVVRQREYSPEQIRQVQD